MRGHIRKRSQAARDTILDMNHDKEGQHMNGRIRRRGADSWGITVDAGQSRKEG